MGHLSRKAKFFGVLAMIAAFVGASLMVMQSTNAAPKPPQKDDSGFSMPRLGF